MPPHVHARMHDANPENESLAMIPVRTVYHDKKRYECTSYDTTCCECTNYCDVASGLCQTAKEIKAIHAQMTLREFTKTLQDMTYDDISDEGRTNLAAEIKRNTK